MKTNNLKNRTGVPVSTHRAYSAPEVKRKRKTSRAAVALSRFGAFIASFFSWFRPRTVPNGFREPRQISKREVRRRERWIRLHNWTWRLRKQFAAKHKHDRAIAQARALAPKKPPQHTRKEAAAA